MTIVEQIKAEIERLTDELELQARENAEANNGEATDYCFGVVDMQMNLLSFLDTLESEKPMQEGLEEEIQVERKKLMEVFGPMNGEQVLALKDFARHFAQWGAEHLADARKTSPKDLADAAKFSSRLDGFFYGKGYEQAEKDLGWISVKDKLPGPSEWVLACIEQHGHAQCLTLAVYSEETKEWHTDHWEDGEEETVYVEYWMPIPNIIKEAKK